VDKRSQKQRHQSQEAKVGYGRLSKQYLCNYHAKMIMIQTAKFYNNINN